MPSATSNWAISARRIEGLKERTWPRRADGSRTIHEMQIQNFDDLLFRYRMAHKSRCRGIFEAIKIHLKGKEKK